MKKDYSAQTTCLTITVDEAAAILGVSRSLAYTYVEQAFQNHEPFKVLKIGKCYRILKDSFFDYVLGGTEVSA